MALIDAKKLKSFRKGVGETVGQYQGGLVNKREQDRFEFQRLQQEFQNKQQEKKIKAESLWNKLPYLDPGEVPATMTEALNLAGVEGEFKPEYASAWQEKYKNAQKYLADKNLGDQEKYDLLKRDFAPFMAVPALQKSVTGMMAAAKPGKVDTGKAGKALAGKSKDAFAYVKTVLQKPNEYGQVMELDTEKARKAAMIVDDLIGRFPEASPQKIGEMALQQIETMPDPSEAPGYNKTTPKLDQATAAQFLSQAGGDKNKARQLARDAGYTF